MSDESTDLARDQERTQKYSAYLHALLAYLTTPSDDTRTHLFDAAVTCDAIPHGFWQGCTTLTKDMDTQIAHLQHGTPSAWDEILTMAEENVALFRGFTRSRLALHPDHHARVTGDHRILANRILILADHPTRNVVDHNDLITVSAQVLADYEATILRRITPSLTDVRTTQSLNETA